MDTSRLVYLKEDGSMRSPVDFRRSVTCPQIGNLHWKPLVAERYVRTARSCQANPTGRTVTATTAPRLSRPEQAGGNNGNNRSSAETSRPKTPKTAIALYSPFGELDGTIAVPLPSNEESSSRKSSKTFSLSVLDVSSASNVVKDAPSPLLKKRSELKYVCKYCKRRSIRKRRSKSYTGGGLKQERKSPSQVEKFPETKTVNTNATLLDAAQKGDSGEVRRLLDSMDSEGNKYTSRNALHLACGYGQVAVVEELLQAGADANVQGETGRLPLHEACQGGHAGIVRVLLDRTRELDTRDREGRSAAHVAAFNGEVECLRLLVSRGPYLELRDLQGRQLAHLAAIRNHRNVLKFLHESGLSLDCVCNLKKLPVHYAAQHGALESLVFLVERNCDVSTGDRTGQLPVHYAASNNRLECLRFLVKQGTSLDVTQSSGRTPVHTAAMHGSVEVLHWILDRGANPNTRDNNFYTPLHLAAEHGHAQCFQCLLQHGADLEAGNSRGDRPMASAKKSGHALLMDKAVRNEEQCPQCRTETQQREWAKTHPTPEVVKSVSRMASSAYSSPVPKAGRPLQGSGRRAGRGDRSRSLGGLPRRDVATNRYFGHHLPDDLYQLKLSQ